MKIRLLNIDNDDETICEIETETDLEGTLMIINDITEYCILNNIYERANKKILYDTETDALEIKVRSI